MDSWISWEEGGGGIYWNAGGGEEGGSGGAEGWTPYCTRLGAEGFGPFMYWNPPFSSCMGTPYVGSGKRVKFNE